MSLALGVSLVPSARACGGPAMPQAGLRRRYRVRDDRLSTRQRRRQAPKLQGPCSPLRPLGSWRETVRSSRKARQERQGGEWIVRTCPPLRSSRSWRENLSGYRPIASRKARQDRQEGRRAPEFRTSCLPRCRPLRPLRSWRETARASREARQDRQEGPGSTRFRVRCSPRCRPLRPLRSWREAGACRSVDVALRVVGSRRFYYPAFAH